MRSNRLLAAVASILVLVVPLVGCGGDDSPTAAPTPVPTPTPLPYIGNWSGTTSQGRPFSFTVVADGVSALNASYRMAGGGCTVTGTMTLTFPQPRPITGSSFTFSSSGGTNLTGSGAFSSPAVAAGEFTVTERDQPCAGLSSRVTWNAAKS